MTLSFPISCSSIALRDQSVFEAVRTISEAGFSAIEIWHPHIAPMSQNDLGEVRRACDQLDLTITVLAPYFSFTQGRERWEKSVRDAERVLESARILGVKKFELSPIVGFKASPISFPTTAIGPLRAPG